MLIKSIVTVAFFLGMQLCLAGGRVGNHLTLDPSTGLKIHNIEGMPLKAETFDRRLGIYIGTPSFPEALTYSTQPLSFFQKTNPDLQTAFRKLNAQGKEFNIKHPKSHLCFEYKNYFLCYYQAASNLISIFRGDFIEKELFTAWTEASLTHD